MDFGISKKLAGRGFYLGQISKECIDIWQQFRPTQTEHELIRLGTTPGDGGYLIPKIDLGILMSAGIADNCDFESDFVKSFGKRVFMLDASIDSPPDINPLFNFSREFLGYETKGSFVSLDEWTARTKYVGDDIALKLDIEGFEYEVIANCNEDTLKRFAIIILELHSIEQLVTALGARLIASTLRKLKTNHTIVHLHGNNFAGTWDFPQVKLPTSLEITLIRNDLFSKDFGFAKLPHPLDSACDLKKADFFPSWN